MSSTGRTLHFTRHQISRVCQTKSKIFFVPFGRNKVVVFDPFSITHPLNEIGDDFGSCEYKWRSGVVGLDGNIYCIPFDANNAV